MESDYRKQVELVFNRIEKALESVDPDLVECELTQGSLVLTFTDRSKCILSMQPSVAQIWLALASQGTAYHFNQDPESGRWKDDKGKGIELTSYLADFLKQMTGLEIKL